MELKEWLDINRMEGAERISKEAGVDVTYVYRWASGDRTPEVENAIAIYRATNGVVSYKKLLGDRVKRTHPEDMFLEIDDWKKKNVD